MPVRLRGKLGTAVVDDRHRPRYRYHLTRNFCEGEGRIAFVMFNPSTADHCLNDDTVEKCISLARGRNYRTLEVGNLYARYATNPDDLQDVVDPVGKPYNDEYLRCIATRCDKVVAAWGAGGKVLVPSLKCRANHVLQILHCAMESAGRPPVIHRLISTATADGHPLHPARKSVGRLEEWNNPHIE